ncbi:MAG: TrbI/VirB10 family protein [Allosphingosinicella sp.]
MASRTPPIDPRLAAATAGPDEGAEAGVRPVVALPRSGPSGLLIAIGIALAAIILFVVLDSRRRAQLVPATKVTRSDAGLAAAPAPPLYIPPAPAPAPVVMAPVEPAPAAPEPRPRNIAPAPMPQPMVQYIPQPQPSVSMPPPPQRQSNSPTLVFDNTAAGAAAGPPGSIPGAPGGDSGGLSAAFGANQAVSRVRSSLFANRGTTVVQGTLIPAVLETAFDSRRPGFARAVVSRDVRGFDGAKVLIPRGSRLMGEYRSDIQPGQRRALINWTRLIRPDGVTIAIGSPAADTLGRGGVKGHYDSHFFERFAGAILMSALQVGVNLAAQESGSTNIIVGAPSATASLAPLLESTRIVPTLTVPAGTSISVFVARDLDFTASEKER